MGRGGMGWTRVRGRGSVVNGVRGEGRKEERDGAGQGRRKELREILYRQVKGEQWEA